MGVWYYKPMQYKHTLNVYETAAVTVQIRNLLSSRCAVVEGLIQAHVGHAEGNWRNLQSWKYARYSSPSYERLCRIWKAIFHGISFEHIEPHLIRKYGLIMHTLEWNSVSNSLGKLWTIHQCIGITLWHKLLKLFLTFSHPFMVVQSKTPSQSINQWLAFQFSRNGTRRNNFLANETVFMWLLPALRTWWPWLN